MFYQGGHTALGCLVIVLFLIAGELNLRIPTTDLFLSPDLTIAGVGDEMFRPAWTSIKLFTLDFRYSFAHAQDVDFSFNWKKDWQESGEETTSIFGIFYRSRSWKSDL